MNVCLLIRGYVCGESVYMSVCLWLCVFMGPRCVCMYASSWVGVC